MIKVKRIDWKKPSTKLVIVVFTALIGLSSYFIISSYRNYLSSAKQSTLKNLQSISNTLSLQIDPNNIDYLDSLFLLGKNKNEISTDSIFNKVQKTLDKAQIINNLKEPIVIIYHDIKNDKFFYIANATDTIFFGDTFLQIPLDFRSKYKEGGTLGKYKDEFGTWLTSLTPIKNKLNITIGAIEVDLKFNYFIDMANKTLFKNIFGSILVFIIVSAFLLRYVRFVLVSEETAYKTIEEKKNDIIQSIKYASRIQSAILPSRVLVKKYLRDSFIFYKPKDIVAGDFYWIEMANDLVLVAACDCTGHGVPGAMVSVVCHNALNRSVREYGLNKPSSILDKTADLVIENFFKDEETIQDGMDISLCSLKWNDYSKELRGGINIEWAGANIPLWIVHHNQYVNEKWEYKRLEEIKGDKQPVGKFEFTKSFTNQSFSLEKDDVIYLFTDGYADQFGGPNNKKFHYSQMRKLLTEIHDLPMDEQKTKLNSTFESWRGENEQVDDVLVIGIRI